ncbi:MAG: ATPase, T2SS/T4P/T4SS family [Phycisphaeraceae bacterium]
MEPAPAHPPDLFDQPGIAPIREILLDPEVTEIMINGQQQIYVERRGKMELWPHKFANARALEFLIESLLRPSNRSVDVSKPFVDFRLPDGSRVNVIIPPIAIDGATITIRKFTQTLGTMADLMKIGTISERMARLLYVAILGRLNILFCGATGTGKTTTLNILSRYIPDHERIITIEDTAELDLQKPHVVRLECRPPNIEGSGRVTLADLLRNSLRMRPTRIIVGEIRGDEAIEMLAAISSGHEGCLAVLHSSSPRDAMARLEMMVLSRGLAMPLWAIHKQIAGAVDLVVQHELLIDGSRKVTSICEVADSDDQQVELRELFGFQSESVDSDGKVIGKWVCSGVEPHFLVKLDKRNVELPKGLFKQGNEGAEV